MDTAIGIADHQPNRTIAAKSFQGRSIVMEAGMPRKRALESQEERDQRLKREALRILDDDRAAEEAVDAMVKRSIRRFGP